MILFWRHILLVVFFVPNNRHLREDLIFFFHLDKTAAEAHRELQKVYGDAALSETTRRD